METEVERLGCLQAAMICDTIREVSVKYNNGKRMDRTETKRCGRIRRLWL